MNLLLRRSSFPLLALPPLEDLLVWLTASDFDGSKMPDQSGNGNDAILNGAASLEGEELTIRPSSFFSFPTSVGADAIYFLVKDDGDARKGLLPLIASGVRQSEIFLIADNTRPYDLSLDGVGPDVGAARYNGANLGTGGDLGDGSRFGQGYKSIEVQMTNRAGDWDWIGRFMGQPEDFNFSGQLLEVLLYSGVQSETERVATRAYLNQKYAVANF